MGKLYQKRIEGGNTIEEKTYFNGAQAVAMRKNGTLYWLVGDHLGSTNLTASADGTLYSEIRYSAYGEVRFDNGTTPTKFQYTGQLSQMDETGLYYYVARFYDPVISHFTQADSIIPDPYSSISWDRYAYSKYAPTRFVDPSGHRECESTSSNSCGFMAPRTMSVVRKIIGTYGVKLTGDWTVSEGYTAYLATYLTGKSLRPYTHSSGSIAFKKGFGSMEYYNSSDLGGWYGKAEDGKVSVLKDKITVRLMIHELGHSFEKHIYENNGSKYYGTNNPIQMLIDQGVYDIFGNLITGKGNRNNSLKAPENGYYSDNIPDQYHPKNIEDGDNAHEDWADMFMNWVMGTFYPNFAGAALDQWITTNMSEWIH